MPLHAIPKRFKRWKEFLRRLLSPGELMNIDSIAPALNKASLWVLIWSVVVFTCGMLAMILPLTFSFAIAFVIGSLVLVAGIAHFVFAFHTRGLGGFLGHMLLFAIYEI